MASAICLTSAVKIVVPTLIFIVEDDFGALCASAAERLLSEFAVIKAKSSNLGAALGANRPALVAWPSQKPLLPEATIRVDLTTRAADAIYIPIVARVNHLLVGPLFGLYRSCASCWEIRQSRLSPSGNAHNTRSKEILDPHNASPKLTLASLAVCGMLSLLHRKCGPFSSPYFLYDVRSRQVRRGVLISTHECVTCRADLRSVEGYNTALRQLIYDHKSQRE
jgi:hypothetical protein